MPIRRRRNKARPDEATAWAMFMQAGCDFFDDLAAAGLTESAAHAFAEATWHRIGYDVLAVLDALHDGFPPYQRPIWAEEQFGKPNGERRYAC
ncbi:hypothetical protein EOA60_08275 [Mesorhizobium sp. M1A.F.Ca.IN.020.06.1.1]|uniref:hypothetical protein n=1 Tax=unclassified Mesorhizobium TaxID=325217 RepID=UPI000FCB962D|nr:MULTISPECIES: hypothetical protein [unclassified Mesorhizobium]RUV89194.1 hypothetical protein EOA51_04600 [Mesorhizobium sp. M1A.F.Ca.IN.020.32.1.1]RUW07821.1 hypothetical protein EOA46_22610 [Mesorhizobium sp. M1A.F.Ca.IN.022.05.2.1]RUW33074.1 hypothetical protein EOA60_08275 [Mesorhizobium sp. M1A.F.Ca.IN.020.06.1.1]RWF81947.1 MAG: hypothetical protein EOQ35_11905 [Mesorhizobium sp.]RWG01360.1 MAG: hypothetical protein EOQ38_12360 [Mesorhizobium sp.]